MICASYLIRRACTTRGNACVGRSEWACIFAAFVLRVSNELRSFIMMMDASRRLTMIHILEKGACWG